MNHLVVSLVRGSVRTAYGAARHPFTTASQAVGLAKGAARLGVGVVQGRIPGSPPEQHPAPSSSPSSQPASDEAAEPAAATAAAATGAPVEPVTRAPGEPEPSGDVRIPTPDEVAVRAAGPMPGAPGEAFTTEPKVASRDAEHGGSAAGDREAVEGFLEEMEAGEPESPIDAIGTTTPDPDPGAEAALLSDAETLKRAGDRNPGDS